MKPWFNKVGRRGRGFDKNWSETDSLIHLFFMDHYLINLIIKTNKINDFRRILFFVMSLCSYYLMSSHDQIRALTSYCRRRSKNDLFEENQGKLLDFFNSRIYYGVCLFEHRKLHLRKYIHCIKWILITVESISQNKN